MAICSVLFYILVLFFSHQQSEKKLVSGEKFIPDSGFERVLSSDSPAPAHTCQSTLPPGIGRDYGVPLIPSRGPCSPLHPERDPSRGYSTGDSLAARNTQSISVNIHGDSYRYQYLVPVSIGSPRQNLNLLLDTGSNVTWTQCKPCILNGCTNYKLYFETTKSSTFFPICSRADILRHSNQYCTYNISYLDNSTSSGYNARDILFIGSSYQLPNYTFGCRQDSGDELDAADGILGLSMEGDSTFLSQTAPTLGRTFCYCIPPTDSSLGYLLLGDAAPRNCKPEASTPLIDDRDYIVNLHRITFNNETIDVANLDTQTLIDSGTTITRLPRHAYYELRSKFQEYMSKYPKAPSQGKILRTCYHSEDYARVAPPKIVLHFDQADVTLDTAGVVLPAKSDSIVCLAFYKKYNYKNIIGNTQMKNLNVLFDFNAQRVGFGRGNCGS